MRGRRIGVWACAAVLIVACDAPKPAGEAAARDAGVRDAAKAGADSGTDSGTRPRKRGRLEGRVVWRGKVPPPVKVEIGGRDAAKCAKARRYYEREVLVGEDDGLAEVLVAILGLRAPEGLPPREIDVEIGDCAFRPRVIDATVGDSLVIESHDPILVLPLVPDQSSRFQTGILQGQRFPRLLPRAGGFRMTDSTGTHEWMYAHVLVLPHPYHQVTASDGRFEFPDLPPGSYRLSLWHAVGGEKGQGFSIHAGETREMEIALEAPTPTKSPRSAPGKRPPGPD